MNKQTIRDVNLIGKTVLVRVDYNVPFKPNTTQISNDSRITASLPTVKYLIEKGCKILLCSHLGRPKGNIVSQLRMAPVSIRLSELLDTPVVQASECVGQTVTDLVAQLPKNGILMLENIRFYPGEENNEPEFSKALASLANLYVNDAFGTAHRAHASTHGVTKFLPAVAGLLMNRELNVLADIVDSPKRPLVAIMGGAKVSDKIGVLENLAPKVDSLIVGGGMAATFLKANGIETGESLVENEQFEVVNRLINVADRQKLDLILPEDVVVAKSFSETASPLTVDVHNIPQSSHIMDIGPRTVELFENTIKAAKTVVWNGPMGVFEWDIFASGTNRIAEFLASLKNTTTVIGGGSTAEIVISLGLEKYMTHVSTGGGASLEFLAGNSLPGVAALITRNNPNI